MAKVYGNNAHNGNAQLKREYEEKMQAWKGPKTISNVITMIGFIGFMGTILLSFIGVMPSVKSTVEFWFIALVGAVMKSITNSRYEKYKGKADALNIGIQGEEVITSTLTSLPDDYMIFNNVALNYNGQLTEIDCIVLSCFGIWVVEVKSYKGVIHGFAANDMWSRIKTSKSGKEYDSEIKNPLKQVERQVQILSNVLYRKGIRTTAQGYVVFPVAENVNVDSDKVFLNSSQLKREILSYNQVVLPKDRVETIRDVLTQL